jgi:3-deoxy-manno-octulosonate cytidylyltransferase (CMP-KDO synthetase)
MATLATPVRSAAELFDPNCVKVVHDASGNALYFSRAPVPWPRDAFAQGRATLPGDIPFLRHIGIYAYRAGFLRRFAALPRTRLEQVEALEQLRALENGFAIAVREAPEPFPPGVDTAEDLARVERLLAGTPR